MSSTLILFVIFIQVVLLLLLAVLFYWMVRGIFGIPWIRTRKNLSKAMLELAEIKQNQKVVDYGCGDGAIIVHAAKYYGAKGIGYEYLYLLVLYARLYSRLMGTRKSVSFYYKNFLSGEKLPPADIICSYLFPEVNAKLEPLLIRDYPSGTYVVSRAFTFPTLPLLRSVIVDRETIRLYQIP